MVINDEPYVYIYTYIYIYVYIYVEIKDYTTNQ